MLVNKTFGHFVKSYSDSRHSVKIVTRVTPSVVTSSWLEISYKLLFVKNGVCSVVFIDISKDFSEGNHAARLFKLHQIGDTGSFLNIMQPYLIDRSQYVHLWDSHSNLLDTNCGVPQVYVLGPLLLLMHVRNFLICGQHYANMFFQTSWYFT